LQIVRHQSYFNHCLKHHFYTCWQKQPYGIIKVRSWIVFLRWKSSQARNFSLFSSISRHLKQVLYEKCNFSLFTQFGSFPCQPASGTTFKITQVHVRNVFLCRVGCWLTDFSHRATICLFLRWLLYEKCIFV